MPQIIKHRRGSIGSLKAATAYNAEIVVASGSINDLSGPFVAIGSPTLSDNAQTGAFRAISKIYTGAGVPTITGAAYGTVLDGTPYYSSNEETLYVLHSSDGVGNLNLDLTGNIEGNQISSVTINQLNGSVSVIGDVTSSGIFSGNGSGLTGILNSLNASTASYVAFDNVDGLVEFSSSVDNNFVTKTEFTSATGSFVIDGSITDTIITFTKADSTTFDIQLPLQGTAETASYVAFDNVDGLVEFSSSVVSRVSINELEIDNLQTDSASFDSRISDNDTDISNLQTDSASFDSRIDVISSTNFTLNGTANEIEITGTTAQTLGSSPEYTIGLPDNVTIAGDLAVNGGDITTTQTTASIFNSNTTQLNIGGVATDINIGDSTSLTTFGGDIQILGNDIQSSTGQSVITLNGLDATFNRDIYVEGNLILLGDTTEVSISSSTVNIDDNLIRLNAYSPFERYAGIEVVDSGSTTASASLQWDSLNDYWLLQNSNGTSGKIVSVTADVYGSEIDLTTNTIPKATSGNNIGDSLLIDNGTQLSYATDAITVQQSSGNTAIKGVVTLTNSDVTDAAGDTSTLVYRNSSNQIGYVASADTEAVMDQIIGYRASDGSIVASSIIDGGTF